MFAALNIFSSLARQSSYAYVYKHKSVYCCRRVEPLSIRNDVTREAHAQVSTRSPAHLSKWSTTHSNYMTYEFVLKLSIEPCIASHSDTTIHNIRLDSTLLMLTTLSNNCLCTLFVRLPYITFDFCLQEPEVSDHPTIDVRQPIHTADVKFNQPSEVQITAETASVSNESSSSGTGKSAFSHDSFLKLPKIPASTDKPLALPWKSAHVRGDVS